ncbi:MAG: ATP-binding protein [Deltaproteobacteria bacterium]|nr:ATP-binding protein [Deltaproteobacteria bacterium]
MDRSRHLEILSRLAAQFPVVGLLGPRQVGKSTLARTLASRWPGATVFDLEHDPDLARLADPHLALGGLRGLVVIDEVQHRPDLFRALRVLADRPGRPATFLVLGSAGPVLLRQGAESLAGRVAWHELRGVGLDELADPDLLAFRGGLPPSSLAASDDLATTWLDQYLRNLSERDLPQLGIDLPPVAARRFLTMIAHVHGGVLNIADLARSLGVREAAVRRHLDVLEGALLVRRLAPWHENLGKRLVKSPKLYLADNGLLHALLGLRSGGSLLGYPRLGASWESFALAQVLERWSLGWHEVAFWATHAGAELDLLVPRGTRRFGFEFKRTAAPGLTRSMHAALADLALERLFVVHAGPGSFPLAERVDAVSIERLWTDLPSAP